MIALFLLTLTPAADPLAEARESYRAGLEARADAAKARPLFRHAAEACERLWALGHRNPALARNMAQAHLLAGDLPRAIRAYHLGLRLAPNDRDLRAGLAHTREQVPYPAGGALADSARPRERRSPLRFAPATVVYAGAAGLYLLGFLALARAWMTRRPGWWAAGATMLVLAIGVGLWTGWEADRLAAEYSQPLVIVEKGGTSMHRGNGAEYPWRVPERLPEGVELRVLGERGGWLQVQLAGGEVGWVDERRVVKVE